MPKKTHEIKSLYYITHIDNLPSFLGHGILSHRLVQDRGIPYTSIYDAAIVSKRQTKTAPDGKSLWEFANVYFQPRNPMLYRVLHEKDAMDIVVIGVRPRVLSNQNAFIALGNAASGATEILPSSEGRKRISEIWDTINSDWWNAADGSKRKIMAECLVPGSIAPEDIHTIFVASHEAAERVKKLHPPSSVAVVPEPAMFFRPARRFRVTDNLFLADGDMFFSLMQTLTVSVNVVGIMGKGLASRAKYQFPDVYVVYQDACRRRKLGMGKPYLYKREAFVDEELADEPGTLPEVNANKWFLLFATKRHWRDTSDLQAIREGLRWVRDNYAAEGIKSLAMPALGCGLGRLDWQDVGPVMCQELAVLGIQVAIYLPRERQIPEEYLSARYLLSSVESKGG
jgi:O-acetyl-ADP-ribose deacetylase (regulator of RNase III)